MDFDSILIPFGTNLVEDSRKSLKSKGVSYGGGQESKLAASIRFNILEGPNKAVFQLYMSEYGEYRNKGRGASNGKGKGEVRENLEDWVSRKGIVGKSDLYKRGTGSASERFERAKKALGFLFSRKIHRKGYKGNHFFDEVINDGRLVELQKDLAEMIKKDVIIEII